MRRAAHRAGRTAAALAGLLLTGAVGAGEAVSALEQFLRDTRVVAAQFSQELTDPDGRLIEVAAGRLLIARPDRLRWDYTEPDQVVLADGEKLWLFDREVDQVTVTQQADSLSGSPAALLAGDASALAAFDVVTETVADGIAWVALAPLADDVDFASVNIGFKGGELAAMILTDQLGQRTDIRFAGLSVNGAIDANAFALDIPDYVDVIDKSAPDSAATTP